MIGFYDSGLGGLTILKQVHNLYPLLPTIYLGDTLHCPLGEKTDEQIIHYTKLGVSFLFDKGCDLVILACNTATAVSIREIQNNWLFEKYPNKKVLGIIRPVSERMLQIHTNKEINVGIMATPATIKTQFYNEEMKEVGYKNIFTLESSGLASAIEQCDNKKIDRILHRVFSQHVDTIPELDVLILACTHYPIIREQITQKLREYGAKNSIRLLSQGIMVAERLGVYLQSHPEIKIESGINQYYVTSNPADFQKKMKSLFGIERLVKLVDC